MPRIEPRGSRIVERLRDPSLFMPGGMRRLGRPSKFRTVRSGSHLVTVGRLRSTRRLAAQRILHPAREMGGPGRKFSCRSRTCRRL